MERSVLLGILAVQEGLVSAAEMLVHLAGARSSGVELGRTLEKSGRVTSDQWSRLESLAEKHVREHGGLEQALEVLAKRAVTQLEETLSVEVLLGNAKSASIPLELLAEMGPVSPEHPGRYTEIRELGRGAIGRVAAAQDAHLGREVAIKELLPPDSKGPKANPSHRAMQVVRFLREARVTAILEHPSIVPVYELGIRADGSLYYSMKHVKGQTLHDAIHNRKKGPGALRVLLDRYVNLCQAIAYAHSRNVIHRDIKPKNVMLGEFGETILLDWGLAKVLGTADDPVDYEPLDMGRLASQETQAGFTVGTPAYMSPEQAANDRSRVDARTDVWALGVVLYEILTGTVPFQGEWAGEVLGEVLRKEVVPPHQMDPTLDRDLSAICMKCLERDVKQRYQSAKELAADVQAYLLGSRVSVYPYSRIEVLKKFVRHNPVMAALSLALGVALVGGATWITLLFFNSEHHRILAVAEGQQKAVALEQVQEEKEHVEAARLASDRSSREAHLNLSVALEEEARRRLSGLDFLGSDVFAASALLHTPHNRLGPHAYPGEPTEGQKEDALGQMANLRSLLYFGEVNRRHELAWSIPLTDGIPVGVGLLADGNIGVILDNGLFLVVDGQTHQVTHRFQVAERASDGSFSHDGNWGVARMSKSGAKLFSSSDPTKSVSLLRFPNEPVYRAEWSHDGSQLLLSLESGRVLLIPTDGSKEPVTLPFETSLGPKRAVALSPNGKWVAAGTENGDICVLHLVPGAKPECTGAHTGNTLEVVFCADSTCVASSGFDGNVVMRSLDSGKVLWTSHVYDGHLVRMASDTQGKLFHVASHDGWLMLLDAADGRLIDRFRAHQGIVRHIARTDSGQFVTVGDDKRLAVWRQFPPQATQISGAPGAAVNHIDVSADSSKLAAINTQFEVCVWDLGPGALPPVCQQPGQVWSVKFSPDGKWIALGLARQHLALWNLAEGRLQSWPEFELGGVVAVDFTPDSKRIVASSGDRLRVFDVAAAYASKAPKPMWDASLVIGRKTWALDVFPDGDRAVVTSGNSVLVVSLRDGKLLKTIPLSDRDVTSVQVHADGHTLVASGMAGPTWLVDAETGRLIREFRGHEAWVNTARLSPDGRYLLTASDDKSFRIWNAETGEPIIIGPTPSEVLGVAFSSDSSRFFVGIGEAVHVYPLLGDLALEDPSRLLEMAQRRQGMVLKGFDLVPSNQ